MTRQGSAYAEPDALANTLELVPSTRDGRADGRVPVDALAVTRDRDRQFRRLLATADLLAATLALLAASYGPLFVGGYGPFARDELQIGALAALPVILVLAKTHGLYDRDEVVLHKSTLDDAPAVFQLATLFVVFVWLGEHFLINGAFTKVQFAIVWGVTFAGTLAAQAEQARARRAQRCAEAAARASPKIQLVVALLLVPSVLLLVAAALIPSLMPR